MEEERPYLGMQHPLTGEWYWYATLPMGSTNLPGIAGHFGAAFLQMVMENDPHFQGTPMTNDFTMPLHGYTFDQSKGLGRVLISEDGRPAVMIFLWVDDALIHGPTYEKTSGALKYILDTAV
jgi:hypothetical protein